MEAVFILCVSVTSGENFKSFTLQNFDGVSYYSGTIGMDDLLGKRDHDGFALACLDLNRENTAIELTVGAPEYYRGNSRSGPWMAMFLNTLSPPTPSSMPIPTISLEPTLVRPLPLTFTHTYSCPESQAIPDRAAHIRTTDRAEHGRCYAWARW